MSTATAPGREELAATYRGPTRFNHIAMSLPADALDDAGRAAIVDFYSSVFGWEEIPQMTEDRHRLVLSVHRVDQFLFLIADDHPMSGPRMDHFGVAVQSLDELQILLDRVHAFAEHDDRVDLIDYQIDDHGMVRIHAFYVGFLLPMMVEVQFFEFVS